MCALVASLPEQANISRSQSETGPVNAAGFFIVEDKDIQTFQTNLGQFCNLLAVFPSCKKKKQ